MSKKAKKAASKSESSKPAKQSKPAKKVSETTLWAAKVAQNANEAGGSLKAYAKERQLKEFVPADVLKRAEEILKSKPSKKLPSAWHCYVIDEATGEWIVRDNTPHGTPRHTQAPAVVEQVQLSDEDKALVGRIALAARDACKSVDVIIQLASMTVSDEVRAAAKAERKKLLDRINPKNPLLVDVIIDTPGGKAIDQVSPRSQEAPEGSETATKEPKQVKEKKEIRKDVFGTVEGTSASAVNLAIYAKKDSKKGISIADTAKAAGCSTGRVRTHLSTLKARGYVTVSGDVIKCTGKEYVAEQATEKPAKKAKPHKASKSDSDSKSSKKRATAEQDNSSKRRCDKCKKLRDKRQMNKVGSKRICDDCLDG